MTDPLSKGGPARPGPVFVTTHWTLVQRASGNSPEAAAALSELCDAYWMPVFRFLCREGRREDAARELTQEFFSRLLARGGGMSKLNPKQGRFRSYLLGALKHFLGDLKRKETRQKRGGGVKMESIEATDGSEDSEGREIPDPAAQMPDAYFDRQWAMAVMDRALEAVELEFKNNNRDPQFAILKAWLIGDSEGLSQAEAARQLNMTEGAVKVAIHRLRKNFRNAIQLEIAQTVSQPDEAAAELRYLIEVLS